MNSSSLIPHPSSLIPHPSSLIPHPSSLIPHPSSLPRKGFSLVELIVVIGIIGVLAGVLLGVFSGSGDSAKAARCLSNMKNLAAACQTYAMEEHHYPLAGNRIYLSVDESRGIRNVQKKYTDVPGWVSQNTEGKYPGASYSRSTPISLYSEDLKESEYALTNGALYKYVSGNRSTYVCPQHVIKHGKAGRVNWSYLMNAYFGYDNLGRASTGVYGRKEYGQLARADKILLFSEVPFSGYNSWQPEGSGGSTDTDAILNYSASGTSADQKGASGGGNEEIGVNHIRKREAYAHIAFADGHVEKLRVPMKNGKPDTSQMRQLTGWLCTGTDVSFDGKRYTEVKQ